MSAVKNKRKLSRFEAQHHFYQLRNEVTLLVLNDFGFSPKTTNLTRERMKDL